MSRYCNTARGDQGVWKFADAGLGRRHETRIFASHVPVLVNSDIGSEPAGGV